MITLEQLKEQKRKTDDLWLATVVAHRVAAKAGEVLRKMMCEYYERQRGGQNGESAEEDVA